MREMKNSGIEWIGEIPVEWEIRKIKNCVLKRDGGAWGEEAQNDSNDIICIRVADFDYERMIVKKSNDYVFTKRNYTEETIQKLLLSKGDILLEKSGGGEKTPVGRTIVFDMESKCLFANFIERLRVRKEVYYKFLQYYFVTFYKNGYVKNYIKQTTGIQNLDVSTLLEKEHIAVPSLDEQHRIADYLDEKCAKIDVVIEKQKQVIEKLKEYKLSVITEAVTKGLDPTVPMKDSGVEWIGEIPEGWKIGKIKSAVFKVGSGKTPKGGSEIYSDEGILFIRSQNVYDEGLKLDNSTYISSDIDNEMSNTRVYGNDVLLNITGGSIGRTCIYPKGMPSANVNQHVCIIRTKEEVIKPEYMHYFWMSYCGKTSIDIFQTGANREGLNFEQINNTRIPYMSLSEQEGIITFLDKKCLIIDSAIAKKLSIVEKLTEYKKSLIYEVVTGKREV